MKRSHFFLSLAFILLLPAVCAYSQKYSQNGFILTANSDTIHGAFDYRNKWKNPNSILFKPENSNTPSVITPQSVKGFTVGRYRYVSGEIKKGDLWSGNYGVESKDTGKIALFLMTLFEGEKDLYVYYDENNKPHLFIPGTNGFEKLIYREYIDRKYSVNASVYWENLKKDERYKGQLILYLQECEKVKSEVSALGYSSGGIFKLYSKYYKCIDRNPDYKLEKEKIAFKPGVTGGLALTNFFTTHVNDYSKLTEIANADYSLSANPTFGAFCEMVLPRNKNKWSLVAEIIYTSMDVNGKYTDYESSTVYNVYTSSIHYAYLGPRLLARYSFPFGSFRMFINTGIRVNFQLSGKNQLDHVLHVNGTIIDYPATQAFKTKKHEEGLLFGLGAGYGRFSLEARYGTGDGISRQQGYRSDMRQLSFLLGVRVN